MCWEVCPSATLSHGCALFHCGEGGTTRRSQTQQGSHRSAKASQRTLRRIPRTQLVAQSPSSQLICSAKPLTLLKLYPHASIILDLLDHLSAPANNHPDRMPGHRHLREGWGRVQLGPVPAAVAPSTHHTQPMALHYRGRPALTSMPPPIRDPYSFRSPKPPWSRSRRMSITISQACCKHTGHALLQHRSPGIPPPKGPRAEAEPISAPLSSCPAVPRGRRKDGQQPPFSR